MRTFKTNVDGQERAILNEEPTIFDIRGLSKEYKAGYVGKTKRTYYKWFTEVEDVIYNFRSRIPYEV